MSTPFAHMHQRTFYGSTSQATQVRQPLNRSWPTCLASRYWRSTYRRWWTALIRGPVPTPMQQSAQLAAEAWGAHRTWLLTNGASKGNLVTCLALRHVGELIVAQRSMHSSVMDGMVLGGLQCHFVQPVIDVELGAAHGITPESLAEALDTFPGAVSGVRCLAELLRRGIGPSGAGRCRPLTSLRPDRGRGLGVALRFPPRPTAECTGQGCRRDDLEYPQAGGEPHPVGNASPRQGPIRGSV